MKAALVGPVYPYAGGMAPPAAPLAADPHFRAVYRQDRVWVFEAMW
jgi:hypothetical protein